MPLVLELLCNVPWDLYPGRCEGFEEYLTLKEQICYDYRHPPDCRRLYVEGQRSVREIHPANLRYGLRVDDGPLMLEYCLRSLAVCYPLVAKNVNPLPTSQRLAGVDQPPPETEEEIANFRLPEIRSITPRLRLQGLACYAHINFFSCWAEEQRTLSYVNLTAKSSAMFNACSAANICVGLGFIPPVALRIASWLATTKARYGVDVRQTDKFKELTHLWATHANYLSRLQLKETVRLKRVAKAPHLYRCANDGCEIQATNKSALRRCGGPCPPERKPRYCCELCQRQHWTIHREFCKTDTTNSATYTDIIDDDGDPDWLDIDDFHEAPLPPWEHDWPLFADREGPEIFIDIPNDSPFRKGEIIRLKTRTLSPDCLSAYRSLWLPVKDSATSKQRAYVENLMISPPVNMGFPKPEPKDLASLSMLDPW